ncbi:MAG: DUF503 domain-containing protein [Spirochaetes bacterium]|nr:DUF503 domain-containing protein [Spirochaetota bacterium]
MIRLIIEIPETGTIKDKRRVVNSVKQRLRQKFRMSCAEVDLQESRGFAELGGAYVSNSRELGEGIMNKALAFVEGSCALRIHDVQIHSETYG